MEVVQKNICLLLVLMKSISKIEVLKQIINLKVLSLLRLRDIETIINI